MTTPTSAATTVIEKYYSVNVTVDPPVSGTVCFNRGDGELSYRKSCGFTDSNPEATKIRVFETRQKFMAVVFTTSTEPREHYSFAVDLKLAPEALEQTDAVRRVEVFFKFKPEDLTQDPIVEVFQKTLREFKNEMRGTPLERQEGRAGFFCPHKLDLGRFTYSSLGMYNVAPLPAPGALEDENVYSTAPLSPRLPTLFPVVPNVYEGDNHRSGHQGDVVPNRYHVS